MKISIPNTDEVKEALDNFRYGLSDEYYRLAHRNANDAKVFCEFIEQREMLKMMDYKTLASLFATRALTSAYQVASCEPHCVLGTDVSIILIQVNGTDNEMLYSTVEIFLDHLDRIELSEVERNNIQALQAIEEIKQRALYIERVDRTYEYKLSTGKNNYRIVFEAM